MLLHDFLIQAARRTPGKVALVSEGQRWTYAELDRRSDALAHFLRGRGVARGDRVALFLDNTVEAVVGFWGALKADAVVTIFNPQTKGEKLTYLLEDCEPAALLVQAWHEPVFGAVVGNARTLKAIVVARAKDPAALGTRERFVSWEEAVADGGPAGPPTRRAIDLDLAAIVYTSGSTGEPKGVMLSHLNMLTAARSITSYLGNTTDDVILCALPFSFDYGLYQMIMAFAAGGRLVLEKSFAYSAEMLRLMVDEGVTGFPGVPTMFAMIEDLKHLPSYDFSRVRYVTNTAAALSPRLLFRLREIFPAARVFSMYGLTECKRCTYLPPADLPRKPDSVGIAIPNTELWIVDEHGAKLGPGQVGELVIRGATVMKGYWEKPEATARKLRPGPVPGEHVLYTGDLCRLDDEGYLYFVGRMDEVIKSRGEKVPPKAVESTLLAIPGVCEAAVIGVPDELLGHAIKAFVVLEPGAVLDARTIQRECKARLESFMVPTHIEVRDALPRTANGKIHKGALS